MSLTLSWSRYDGVDCLRVGGAAPGQQVAVYPAEVIDTATVGVQPMAGRVEANGDDICFVPRFPFVEGTAYAVLTADGDTATLLRPSVERPVTTSVVALYPTASEIPFNQLKLYVHFSAPMSEGYALRHVRVVDDATGTELQAPFHPMDPELWDPSRRRLTMLFDPARIKRGLAPHGEMGYPLQPGTAVRVVIDREFCDARGVPLALSFQRRYEVGEAVRAKVDPHVWTIDPPAAGSTSPATVRFDRPLDHALLQHCLTVVDGGDRVVEGAVSVGADERTWQRTPSSPWSSGSHALVVDPMLEDLAGNSVARVFDRDLARAEDEPFDGARIAIDFAIR